MVIPGLLAIGGMDKGAATTGTILVFVVGSLLMVGRGERPQAWMAELLAGRDRTLAGPTAPATGLVFVGPRYGEEWNLPADIAFPQRKSE